MLALLFMVVIGVLVGAIATWTANGLSDTLTFQKAGNVQSALSSATNVAIQNIRYTPLITGSPTTLNASPPSVCFGSASPSQVTTQVGLVDVWCSTVWTPTSANTRVVTVSACLNSADGGIAATCAQQPGLQTVVTFDDYSAQNPNISSVACTAPPTGTCGTGMTISSSLKGVSSPTVTGLFNPATHAPLPSGPVSGTGTMEVDGTGFQTGSTWVSFVGTTATGPNLVLTATNVTVTSPTTLTLTVPPATTVGLFNVVVTTPNGVSATGTACQYTYNAVTPTVTSVTTASGQATGSAAGGSTVIITGTGFLTNFGPDSTTVEFFDQTTGVSISSPPNTVVVNATGTQVTAATPAISTLDLNYDVVILTSPGQPSLVNRPTTTFTYSPLVPLVASATPNTGATGTVVTVTGVGFINTSTSVQLVPTGGGTTLNITSANVTFNPNQSNTFTFAVPAGAKTSYYVEVTTPSGSSGSSGAPQFTHT